MLILGIETSCDETAAALVENGCRIRSSIVASSAALHRRYGGIVPEMATRHQVDTINPVIKESLKKAKAGLDDIDAVSVVYTPGLVGTLLIGVVFAKSLAYVLKKPLIGINHLEAHIYSGFMPARRSGGNKTKPKFPFIGLLVSGGHTSILYVKDFDKFTLLGDTQDDACGEAFDKVAKILGLGYPGGPLIERLAEKGDPHKIRFPRTDLNGSYDFSFSGLKTAVLYYVRKHIPASNDGRGTRDDGRLKQNIAASFQEAAVDVLVDRTIKAAVNKKVKYIVVGGGVSANKRLRAKLKETAELYKMRVYFPPMNLCIDNAAMVAGLAYHKYKKGIIADMMLTAEPNVKW